MRLASIWEWSRASGIIRKSAGSSTDQPGYHRSRRIIYNQIEQDRIRLRIPHTSQVVLRASLSTFLINQYSKLMEGMIEQRLNALGMIRDSECDISFLKTTSTTTGSPEEFRSVSIACSVAGSGKTQHMFNQLYEHYGHYIISGRVPRQTSSDFLHAARHGKASMDTAFLYELLGQSPDTEAYHKCLLILIDNRQRILRSARTIYSKLKRGDLKPSQWLLFQTVCIPHFDPFLETFKLALFCDFPHFGEDASTKQLDDLEFICFDEVQCEMSFEHTSSDEPQALDTFLDIVAKISGRQGFALRLLLSGTSLQVNECVRRAKNAGMVYARLNATFPRLLQHATVLVDVFDRFNFISNYEEFHDLIHNRVKRLIDQAYFLASLDSEVVEQDQL